MWEILLFCFAINLDAFCFAFAFGIKKTRLSFYNILTICIVNTFMLCAGLFISYFLHEIIQSDILTEIGASVLIALGAYYIILSFFKWYLDHLQKQQKQLKFKVGDYSLVLDVSLISQDAEETKKTLRFKEALLLGFVTGIDGFCGGLACGYDLMGILTAIGIFIAMIFLFVLCGVSLGHKIAKKINLDFAWLSGIILIIIGVIRLM